MIEITNGDWLFRFRVGFGIQIVTMFKGQYQHEHYLERWMLRYVLENCVEKHDYHLMWIAGLPVQIYYPQFEDLYALVANAPTVQEMINQKGVQF